MMRATARLAAMLILAPSLLGASEVVVAVGRSLPPYVIADRWRGLEYDVVKEALAVEGHVMRPRAMVLARVQKEFNAGLVDAAMTMRPDIGIAGCYSDSHVSYRNYAITLESHGVAVNSVADLAGKSVVAFQNAKLYLGADYAAAVEGGGHRYREEAKQVVQPLLLYSGRADVVIADKYIFGWFAAAPEVVAKVDTRQALRYHPIFPPTEYHVAFRDKGLCDSFNRGLAKVRADGTYDRIIARYAGFLEDKGGLSH